MSDAIVIEGVTKRFGPRLAVDDLHLRVPAGTLCGFIGPNGAGKTTTIRMIMSILFPDRGDIRVLGRGSALESKDRIGYLPEERGVYRKMRVASFLSYMGRLKGMDAGPLKKKVEHWLERVGLADSAKKRCEELSKGMQQKVQFIAAVIHEPELIILDEPFSGLDPVNRRLLRELIDEQHRAGRTMIFSTHAMYEAEQLCEQVFMIHQGVKMLDASLAEIRARFDPRTIVVEPAGTGDHGGTSPAQRDQWGKLLAAVPGVETVTERTAGSGGAGGGNAAVAGYTLRLDEERGNDPSAVIRDIAARLQVRRIEVKRVDLEDVFIELVERSGHDAPSRAELRETMNAAASSD